MGVNSHKRAYSEKSLLTVRCIFHIQPGIAMGKQSQGTMNCLADSYGSVEKFTLNKF